MKIYLAAPYDRRWQMLGIASTLERAGHEVTSRWIAGGRGGDPPSVTAVEDLIDLSRAQCLVSFAADAPRDVGATCSARHVELGVALATGKRLCLVGPRENNFHHLQSLEVYDSVADLVAGLNGK